MNLFLLFILLQNLTNNWAVPIDPLGANAADINTLDRQKNNEHGIILSKNRENIVNSKVKILEDSKALKNELEKNFEKHIFAESLGNKKTEGKKEIYEPEDIENSSHSYHDQIPQALSLPLNVSYKNILSTGETKDHQVIPRIFEPSDNFLIDRSTLINETVTEKIYNNLAKSEDGPHMPDGKTFTESQSNSQEKFADLSDGPQSKRKFGQTNQSIKPDTTTTTDQATTVYFSENISKAESSTDSITKQEAASSSIETYENISVAFGLSTEKPAHGYTTTIIEMFNRPLPQNPTSSSNDPSPYTHQDPEIVTYARYTKIPVKQMQKIEEISVGSATLPENSANKVTEWKSALSFKSKLQEGGQTTEKETSDINAYESSTIATMHFEDNIRDIKNATEEKKSYSSLIQLATEYYIGTETSTPTFKETTERAAIFSIEDMVQVENKLEFMSTNSIDQSFPTTTLSYSDTINAETDSSFREMEYNISLIISNTEEESFSVTTKTPTFSIDQTKLSPPLTLKGVSNLPASKINKTAENLQSILKSNRSENITTISLSLDTLTENHNNTSSGFPKFYRSNFSSSFDHVGESPSGKVGTSMMALSTESKSKSDTRRELQEDSNSKIYHENQNKLTNSISNIKVGGLLDPPKNLHGIRKTSSENFTTTVLEYGDHTEATDIITTTKIPEFSTDFIETTFVNDIELPNKHKKPSINEVKGHGTNKELKKYSSTIYKQLKTYNTMQETTNDYSLYPVTEETTESEKQYLITNKVSESATISSHFDTTVLPQKLENQPQPNYIITLETGQDPIERIQNNLINISSLIADNTLQMEFRSQAANATGIEDLVPEQFYSGDINRQNLMDKFNVYSSDSSNDDIFVSDRNNKRVELHESDSSSEQAIEVYSDFETLRPMIENFNASSQTPKKSEHEIQNKTTVRNEVEAEESMADETTRQADPATTEYLLKTTTASPADCFSVNATAADITELSTQEPPRQNVDTTWEFSSTIQTIEKMGEVTTLVPTLPEMVTFIENIESTTSPQIIKETKGKVLTRINMHDIITEAPFMKEREQQVKSTPMSDAQTESAEATGQTATTIDVQDLTGGHLTTEENQSNGQMPAEKTTIAQAALPLTKLEYLQSADGVEIFYGYSLVKHN